LDSISYKLHALYDIAKLSSVLCVDHSARVITLHKHCISGSGNIFFIITNCGEIYIHDTCIYTRWKYVTVSSITLFG